MILRRKMMIICMNLSGTKYYNDNVLPPWPNAKELRISAVNNVPNAQHLQISDIQYVKRNIYNASSWCPLGNAKWLSKIRKLYKCTFLSWPSLHLNYFYPQKPRAEFTLKLFLPEINVGRVYNRPFEKFYSSSRVYNRPLPVQESAA
jgi:hypothetical protein